MPASNVAAEKRSQPQILVETAGLSEEEWLAYRRKGIGGSDVAALLGISPWRTARDLYFDKLNIVAVEDNEDNWVALEMGHLLEPLVAKIFQHRTGYKVYQIKKMFQHPQYSWMLADVDYFVELPDGSTAILEIKTTNYNARDNWWLNGEETVPVYYETQGRHYMAVMNVDRCFFCCLYGNNEEGGTGGPRSQSRTRGPCIHPGYASRGYSEGDDAGTGTGGRCGQRRMPGADYRRGGEEAACQSAFLFDSGQQKQGQHRSGCCPTGPQFTSKGWLMRSPGSGMKGGMTNGLIPG